MIDMKTTASPAVRNPNPYNFTIGSRVEGGKLGTPDYDAGEVIDLLPNGACTVAWDSHVSTASHLSELLPEGSQKEG